MVDGAGGTRRIPAWREAHGLANWRDEQALFRAAGCEAEEPRSQKRNLGQPAYPKRRNPESQNQRPGTGDVSGPRGFVGSGFSL